VVEAIIEQKGPMLNSWEYLLKIGNIVKSYLELNFIRENTHKKAAVNESEQYNNRSF